MLVTVLWRLAGAPNAEGRQHVSRCAGRHMVHGRRHLGGGKRRGLRHRRRPLCSQQQRHARADGRDPLQLRTAAAMTWARAPTSRRSRMPAACPVGHGMCSRGPMQPALSTARCAADGRSSTRRAALPAQVAMILRSYTEHVVNALILFLIFLSQRNFPAGRHMPPAHTLRLPLGHLLHAGAQKNAEFVKICG